MALVSVSGGCPGPTPGREELAYLALVASLRSPSRPVPARVLGCGPMPARTEPWRSTSAALAEAADRVVECVTAVVEARVGPARRSDRPVVAGPGPTAGDRASRIGAVRRTVDRASRPDSDRTRLRPDCQTGPAQNSVFAALASGLPAAVRGMASTISSCRGIL